MNFHYSPYAVPLFLAAVMTIGLALYAYPRRKEPLALVFFLMTVALSWWSLLYALNISGSNFETQYLFNRLKYLGVMSVPPLWLILALLYTRRQHLLSRRNIALIFLPSILLLLVVLTDNRTHLWWTRVWESEFAGMPMLDSDHALLYYIHIIFAYSYIVLGLWLYLRFYQEAQSMYRSQTGLMIIGAAIPLLASASTQLGLSPLPWGLDSFFFTLSSALLAIAIFRYRLLDIVPVARRTTLEQIPDGVIVIDAGRRVVDANPAALTLVNKQLEEMIGHPLEAAVEIPEIHQTLIEITQNDAEQVNDIDVQIDRRTISLSTTALTHRTQEPIGRIVLMRDITERVTAQQQLQASYQQAELERARQGLILKTTRDPVLLLDVDNTILASNPAARQILKTNVEQFPPVLLELLPQARASQEITQAEIEIAEQHFHVAIAPTPPHRAGTEGTGLVITMHDITHFKHLAQLKDDFVHTVSHDLRSPLTSILGYIQVAQMKNMQGPQNKDVLERIETAAWRMSNLINDLLDLAALDAGVEHESEPVALDMLVRAAIEELDGAAMAKGIAIHYQSNPKPMVQVDPRLITQVWRNLIGNAIKYTVKGKILVEIEAGDDFALGRVKDTGLGISAADIPFIFDKFYRSKKPYTHGIEGTGLGLALVKSIVERHGGRVWVESELGVGSTFTFMLPLCENQAATV